MKNLKNIRKSRKLTQVQVADALHFAHTTYTAYENEKIQPSTETMIKLADYFNTTIDNLVGHEVKHFVDISLLSNTQIELINKIKNCNNNACEKLLSYLDGLQTKDK